VALGAWVDRLSRLLAGTRDLILPSLGALTVSTRASREAAMVRATIRAKSSFITDYNRRRGV